MNANNVSSQVQQKIGSHSPSQKWTWSFTNVNNSDQTVYILGPQEEPPELEDVDEEEGEEEEDPVKLVICRSSQLVPVHQFKICTLLVESL